MTDQKTFLGTEPVGKLLARLALPTVAAQLIRYCLQYRRPYLYRSHSRRGGGSCPDRGRGLYAYHTDRIRFCFPGGLWRFSQSFYFYGKNDTETAEKILGNSFSLLTILSICLTAVLLLWNEPLLLTFGASENTIGYATSYMNIYALGTIFVQLTLGMNSFITAQGFAKTGMLSVLIGAVLNIILDPILNPLVPEWE